MLLLPCLQLSEADAADVSERLEDFLSFCAPPDSNDDFKVGRKGGGGAAAPGSWVSV